MNKEKNETIFIGVSWPYANNNMTIGHLAGQNIVCDVFARYHRQKGNKVLMVSGTDAHGTPVTVKAKKEGLTPKETAKKYHESFLKTFDDLNIQWDLFTTTESPNHYTVAQNLFKTMHKLGFIYPKQIDQYYDPKANQFLADRYIEGTCPYCGNSSARGDQCNGGCERTLDAKDLIQPRSKLSDATPILKQHTILYFDLPKFEKEIATLVKDSRSVWRERVTGFTEAWLKEGLQERPVSRKIGYGIPVPIEEYKDHDIYVWFEAVMGYLSASIEWAQQQEKPSEWEDFWKNPEAKHYYFIAKDNIPFHTILWPAMLIAYNYKYENGIEPKLPGETLNKQLDLPYNVPANQFLNLKDQKISKSTGNLITANELLEHYDTDIIRYFFTKNSPENHDTNFTWKDFIDTNNKELVATLGNFINRVATFAYTKFNGELDTKDLDENVIMKINQTFDTVGNHLNNCEFTRAADSLIELARFGNKYFNDQKPWELATKDEEKSRKILFNCAQIAVALGQLSKPFIPESSEKILSIFGFSNEGLNWEFSPLKLIKISQKPQILFEKLDYPEEIDDPTSKNLDIKVVSNKSLGKEIPITWAIFPNIKIKKQDSKLKKWIEVESQNIKNSLSKKDPTKESAINAYLQLHKKYSSETETFAASKRLIDFIKEKGAIPNINTFVDLYNIFSAKSQITVGAYDLDKLEGDVKQEILKEDEDYLQMNTRQKDTAKKGEFAYTDDIGIISRMDIKQNDRTKITPDTKNVLVILEGNKILDKKYITEELKELTALVSRFITQES